jgi:hypothetical protein
MEMWSRRGEATSARLSAAPYSAHHKLYSEAVASSVASVAVLAEVGRFREAVQYVQKAAKALSEGAREVFEQVKVSLQRLAELFVEAVARVLARVDKHKAYLFLMAAVSAGAVALSVALNMWGMIELEKLAYAASAAPFFAGLAETGEKAAERFRVVAERYERWKMGEKVISEIINAPLNKERPFSKLTSLENLPKAPCGAEEGIEGYRRQDEDRRGGEGRRSGRGACFVQDAYEERGGLRGVGWVVRAGEGSG